MPVENPGERALLLELPRWMLSRAGQWCAHTLPGGARLWKREMDAALERQAEFEHVFARDMMLKSLNEWAALGFVEKYRDAVIREWCHWRNAAERLHLARERRAGRPLAVPLALRGMPMGDDDPAFFELLGKGEPHG
jgi:hypothetical protein